MYARLEISGFALPNTNKFQAKCESLPPNDSQCVRINLSCSANLLCLLLRNSSNSFSMQNN